jgi:hypothetical protein
MVNVDATLFANQWRMAMEAVSRKHDGSCMLAASEPIRCFSSPELVEAMALRRVVTIAKEKVIFASDCMSRILRLNSSAQDCSQGLTLKRRQLVSAWLCFNMLVVL